jgi:hypothetical protein
MSFPCVTQFRFSALIVLTMALSTVPAWAQDPPPVVVTGGLDVVNHRLWIHAVLG